jgi:serine/threonine protein kinase
MGTVLRAMDEARGREVALKLPNDVEAQSINFLKQECDVLMQLEHHNIVQIYGSGSDADPDLPFYIVMEFVDGVTVEELLHQEHGRLEPRRALKIALGVAEALAYAHKPPLRVIHRDIKPGNIMIRRSDEMVKVTDFGIAAVLSQRAGRTGVGTLAYMAPEQATGLGVDERSDLYSLGAMLYEMLTGQRSPQLASAPPRPPGAWLDNSLPQDMRTRIDRLVMGLLQADRDLRRPQRAAEVVEELRAILEGRPSRPVAGTASILQAPTQRSARIPAAAGYPAPAPRPTIPVHTNYQPPYRPPVPPAYAPPARPAYAPPVRPAPRQPPYQPPAAAMARGRAHTATLSLALGVVAGVVAFFLWRTTRTAEALRGINWSLHPVFVLSGTFPQGTLNHISFTLWLACFVPAVLAIIFGGRAHRAILISGKRLRGGALAFFGRFLGVISLVALALILLVAR